MSGRIRRSRKAIRFSAIFGTVVLLAGVAVLAASGGKTEACLVGAALVLGALLGLIGIAVAAKHPSHPLITGLEIEETPKTRDTATMNFADRLRELHSLKEEGIITEEEFASKKAEILKQRD